MMPETADDATLEHTDEVGLQTITTSSLNERDTLQPKKIFEPTIMQGSNHEF